MLPLHKRYETYPLHERGVGKDFDEVLPIVRTYWPQAYMEGSAGLARMFFDGGRPNRFVAYMWGQ